MFDTDLAREYDAARSIGIHPRDAFEAGVAGALCDEPTKDRLRAISNDFEWSRLPEAELV
jgi:aminodeoxyfutalosine deaminase